ncbi:MAG: hypothetical protein ACLGI3_09880 [Actinomycetes bacterium]
MLPLSPPPGTGTDLGGPAAARRLVLLLGAVGAAMLAVGLLLAFALMQDPLPREGRTFVQAMAVEARRLFFPDAEGNAWSWFSALLLAAVAVVLAARARAVRADRSTSARYAILAAIALFMSADEGAQIHEFLNQVGLRITDRLGPFNSWLIPGVVLAAAVGAGLLWVARGIDAALRRRLVLAGAVFLTGAVGFEVIGTAYALGSEMDNPWRTGGYLLLVAAEEALEMLGALIALHAVLARVRIRVAA